MSSITGRSFRLKMPLSMLPMLGTTTSGPPSPISFLAVPLMTLRITRTPLSTIVTVPPRRSLPPSPLPPPLPAPLLFHFPLASNSIDLDKSNSESVGKRPCRRDEVSGSEVMTVVVAALPMPPPSSMWPPMEMITVDLAMLLMLSSPGEGGIAEGDGGRERREELHQHTMIGERQCSLECLKIV